MDKNNNHFTKMALAAYLLRLANVDKNFDKKERKFWFTKIREFSLSIGEQARCIEISRQEEKGVDFNIMGNEKKLWIDVLRGMMMADGEEREEERSYIKEIAEKLGLEYPTTET